MGTIGRMAVARYKVVVDRLVEDIRTGRLAAGTRLPTHRELARREGIALATATRVYAELAASGLVVTALETYYETGAPRTSGSFYEGRATA